MRLRTVFGLLAAVTGLLAGGAWIVAGPHPAATAPILTRQPSFRIPFDWDRAPVAGEAAVAAQLHVSVDGGATWQLHQQLAADRGAFDFAAPADGEYWFVVRTVDSHGRFWPDATPPQVPEMRVLVDRTPPTLSLAATRGTTPHELQVRWQAADALLAADSVQIEYCVGPADGTWHPVAIAPWQQQAGRDFTVGETTVQVVSHERILLRAAVRDLAGNTAQAEASVAAPSTPPAASPIAEVIDRPANHTNQPPAAAAPAGITPLMVNSLSFELDYDLQSVGAGGVARVEVWGTRDKGRNWVLLGTDDDLQSPCSVQVDREGLYGFSIIIESNAGVRGNVPAPGDVPDIWLGVDLQPPTARLTTAEPAVTEYGAALKLKWQAHDAGLAADGISLYYAPRSQGPWLPLANHLQNTGEHVCSLEGHAVDEMYLRLEARDVAGNVTVFDTTQPIHVGAIRNTAIQARGRPQVEAAATSHWYHVLR